MKVGDVVAYWDGLHGLYHVKLLELGYKWAKVEFFGPGVIRKGKRVPKVKRVPVGDLRESDYGASRDLLPKVNVAAV